jgi:glycerophosphoryl diester phosphodiesterase
MTPRLAVALVAAVLTVATSATPAVADPPPLATCDHPPAVVAHRGGNELYVENTLLAFDTSYTEAGAQVWETDVRFDRNNIPVILHDATVDRTSPATGEIAKLAATGSGGRIATDDGQVIPTEWELLDLARQRGARVLLELKVTPANSVQWGNFFNRVDVTVGAAGVAVTSFDAALLAEVHRRRPDLSLGFLDGRGYRSAADIEATGADLYMKEAPSYTRDRFAEWHAAGLELMAWTVDDPVLWRWLTGYPVDGMITDKPVAYRTWLRINCPAS